MIERGGGEGVQALGQPLCGAAAQQESEEREEWGFSLSSPCLSDGRKGRAPFKGSLLISRNCLGRMSAPGRDACLRWG
jgi:hypothetical protein